MKLKMLYYILDIRNKIPHEGIRLIYLKDVWGMEQTLIGECEYVSQGYVSTNLKKYRAIIPHQEYTEAINIQWSSDEIKRIQFLPSDKFSDIEVAAFILDVLGVEVNHPFFTHYTYTHNNRMCGLASLGVQNKTLMVLFKRAQSTVSTIVARGLSRGQEWSRDNRYDKTTNYIIKKKEIATIEPSVRDKFKVVGGGTFNVW